MKNSPVIAQISDCHLFADISSLHCGYNVHQRLIAVLTELQKNRELDAIIFTGDLTQDHQAASYQVFADAITSVNITPPVYFLSGNHDEPELLNRYLSAAPFCADKMIDFPRWQLLLVESKSKKIAGPAGRVDEDQLQRIEQDVNSNKYQMIFTHHHPVDVGYFIDKHGLTNADEFWQVIETKPSIKAIACGHVHREITLLAEQTSRAVPVYTCPATSIQFDPQCSTVSALAQGPAYRLFTLNDDGVINTRCFYLQNS